MGTTALPQPGSNPTPPVAPPPSPMPAPPGMSNATEHRVSALGNRLLAQYGTLENALAQLSQQLVQWSDAYAGLERTHNDLRARVPADGAVVIPKEQKPLWDAVVALNTDAAGLQKIAKEHGEWGTERTTNMRGSTHQHAAAVYRWNAEVLGAELERRGMDVEMRATQVSDGRGGFQQQNLPYVRKRGDAAAAWEPLAPFVGREFSPAYQQALQVAAGQPGQPPVAGQPPAPVPGAPPAPVMAPAPGVPWHSTAPPATQPVNQDFVGDFVKDAQKSRDARPSPIAAVRGVGRTPVPAGTPGAPGAPAQ